MSQSLMEWLLDDVYEPYGSGVVTLTMGEVGLLLGTAEAAKQVYEGLHKEFSHSLAMRDLGKALHALYVRPGLSRTEQTEGADAR